MAEQFHFLHPSWLWALLPLAVLLRYLWRRPDADNPWRRVVAPHLQRLLLGQTSGVDGMRRRRWHRVTLIAQRRWPANRCDAVRHITKRATMPPRWPTLIRRRVPRLATIVAMRWRELAVMKTRWRPIPMRCRFSRR